MNDSNLSVSWGKNRSYLATQKNINMEFYDYLKKHGLPKYQEETDKSVNEIAKMYYYLTEARLMTTFFYDSLQDLYNTPNSCITTNIERLRINCTTLIRITSMLIVSLRYFQ